MLHRLYLSNLTTACDEAQITRLGITHVISVIECAPPLPQTQSLRTLHISLSDGVDEDILTHLPVTTSFISNALAEDPNSRVLVSSRRPLRLFPLFLTESPSGPLSYGRQPKRNRCVCISHRNDENDSRRSSRCCQGETLVREPKYRVLMPAGGICCRKGRGCEIERVVQGKGGR